MLMLDLRDRRLVGVTNAVGSVGFQLLNVSLWSTPLAATELGQPFPSPTLQKSPAGEGVLGAQCSVWTREA